MNDVTILELVDAIECIRSVPDVLLPEAISRNAGRMLRLRRPGPVHRKNRDDILFHFYFR